MAASPGNPADCLKLEFQIQIDTTPRRSETLGVHGLQRFAYQFNRTAVKHINNKADHEYFNFHKRQYCFAQNERSL
jgi:hypothetical protein